MPIKKLVFIGLPILLFIVLVVVFLVKANQAVEKSYVGRGVVLECLRFIGENRAPKLAIVQLDSGVKKRVRHKDCVKGKRVTIDHFQGYFEFSSFYRVR